jgi:protein-S-isoprenylcysteine O-methyltransferase Ste14
MRTVTIPRAAVALLYAALVVFGAFHASTAYGSWSSWFVAALLIGAGALGLARLAREGGASWWLLFLVAATLLAVAVMGTVAVVCNGESGFSCGG